MVDLSFSEAGVNYTKRFTLTRGKYELDVTYKVENHDPEITGALLTTLVQDPNVNVRLAALEALSQRVADPSVREGLVQSITRQSSPLIQMAIVDVAVRFGMKESQSVLREIVRQPGVDQTVKKRIEEALQHLTT